MMNLNPEDHALSAQVLAIAECLYGERPQIRKFHSQVSYVCAMTFTTLPTKVIKLERNEPGTLPREIQRLRALSALDLPVPNVEHSTDDISGSLPFYVTSQAAMLRLGDLVWARRPAALLACRAAGAFLRRSHHYTLDDFPPGIVDTAPIPDFCALIPQLTARALTNFDALIHAITAANALTPRAVCHGQFHTENIVADDSGAFCVVDWDTLRAGALWADIALFLRTMRVWNNGTVDHTDAFWDGLGMAASDHQHMLDTWNLFETATSLNWHLANGYRVEPIYIDGLNEDLLRFV